MNGEGVVGIGPGEDPGEAPGGNVPGIGGPGGGFVDVDPGIAQAIRAARAAKAAQQSDLGFWAEIGKNLTTDPTKSPAFARAFAEGVYAGLSPSAAAEYAAEMGLSDPGPKAIRGVQNYGLSTPFSLAKLGTLANAVFSRINLAELMGLPATPVAPQMPGSTTGRGGRGDPLIYDPLPTADDMRDFESPGDFRKAKRLGLTADDYYAMIKNRAVERDREQFQWREGMDILRKRFGEQFARGLS